MNRMFVYNWPVGLGINGSSFKAWHIAWHSPVQRMKVFYPFMVDAVSRKLLEKKDLRIYEKEMYKYDRKQTLK
ncbi:hypothetical protein [Dyadobacter sp. CY343]|uniref:hypothetical protein n=1 Tax=Dyadobacter sp. CY343 TaxID=2907299 RepID=UPI001F3367A7|nr:hypothetical protein [Dyadobacter sp. CY343]